MKRISSTILALTAIGQIALATDVSGPVSGTWTLSGSPYNVIGQINIPSGQELVIEPGVQVIFQGWYKFLIFGRLQAIGTEADTIIFTAVDTSHGWHGLRFYDINSQPDSTRLVYCKITYGKSSGVNSGGDDKNGGAIFCSNSGKLRIEHCLIAHNRTGDVLGAAGFNGSYPGADGGPGESVTSGQGGAIYLHNSGPCVGFNCFQNNRTGTASGGSGGNGAFDNSYSEPAYGGWGGSGGSGTAGNGGVIFCQGGIVLIHNNIFLGNWTGQGQGGNGGQGGGSASLIYAFGGNGGHGGSGNGGDGAIYFANATVQLRDNLFCGTWTGSGSGGAGGAGGSGLSSNSGTGGSGGGGGDGSGGDGAVLYLAQSNATQRGHTICTNQIGGGWGGGGGAGGSGTTVNGSPGAPGAGINGMAIIYGDGPSSNLISNSIFWNNDGRIFMGNNQVTYSCVEGGYPGIGNINSNPIFVSNALGHYFLSQIAAWQLMQSPCVDAGQPDSTMVIGTTRTDAVQDQGIVDMGYHYAFFTAAPFLYIAPRTLNFLGVFGAGNPQNQIFQISNFAMGSFDFQVVENTDWLTVSPLSGGPVPPTSIETVSVNIDQLLVGNYAGDIVVLAPMAQGSPDTVHVNLLVGNAVLALSEDSLTFIAGLGGGNPPNQIFTINNGGIGTLNYSISEAMDWLTADPMSGGPVPPNAMINVAVDISTLPVGTHEGYIVVSAAYALNSPDSVHVILFIGEPILSLSDDTLHFSHVFGTSGPQPQAFTINNTGTGVFCYSVFDTASWLSVLPLAGGPVPPPAVDTVSILPSGLQIGSYSASIEITAPGAIGSPASAYVQLDVLPGLSGPLSGILGAGVYTIFGNISVAESDSLVLEPGVVFQFGGNYALNINGFLWAEGTMDDSIKFMPSNQTIIWDGIDFANVANDNSRLSYCLITGSTSNAIYCHEASPDIFNCSIVYNGQPPTADNGGGIRCEDYSNPQIRDCWIEHNGANYGGGIACGDYSNPVIDNCIISQNNSAYGFGGGIFAALSAPQIRNCIINDNNHGGISINGADGVEVANCIIMNNGSYAGIHCIGSQMSISYCLISGHWGGIQAQNYNVCIEIDHCTVVANSGPIGSAIWMSNQSSLALSNSIIADNTGSAMYLPANMVTLEIDHCDFYGNEGGTYYGVPPGGFGNIATTNLNGDSCDVYSNIFLVPLFLNPDSGDYHLTAESPCIDAGDPESPFDPDSTIADMGAFYFPHVVGIAESPARFIPETFFLEGNHPNPFNPTTTITFGLPVASWVELEVFDIAGRTVGSGQARPLREGWYEAGVHEVTFDGSDLPSGIYILRLLAGDFSAVEKLILLK